MDIGQLDAALNALDVLRVKSKPNGDFDSVVRDGVDVGLVRAQTNPLTGGIEFSIGGVAYSFDTPAYTWAGRPVAATENVGLVIGAGSLWQSDGVTWRPVNGRVVLSRGQSLAASPLVTLAGATGKLVIPSGSGIVSGSYVAPSRLLQAGFALEVTAKVKKLGTGGTWSIAARLGTGNAATDAAIASGSGAATNDNDLVLSQIAEVVSNTSLISSTFAVPNQPTTGALVDKNTTLDMSATQYVSLWIGALNAADTIKLLSYEIAVMG